MVESRGLHKIVRTTVECKDYVERQRFSDGTRNKNFMTPTLKTE